MRYILVLLFCASSASATLTPRKEGSVFDRPTPTQKEKPIKPYLTDETDVRLDGKKIEYKDLPDNTEVIRMEMKKDGEITILYFRTKKDN